MFRDAYKEAPDAREGDSATVFLHGRHSIFVSITEAKGPQAFSDVTRIAGKSRRRWRIMASLMVYAGGLILAAVLILGFITVLEASQKRPNSDSASPQREAGPWLNKPVSKTVDSRLC